LKLILAKDLGFRVRKGKKNLKDVVCYERPPLVGLICIASYDM
jgi:hypothetical protein